jgi:hypothetical protein
MQVHRFPGTYGGEVELDLCFACQGLWFDRMENLKLAPGAVAQLFKTLHEHRDERQQPLADRMSCPECRGALTQGFDVVRSGRYITHRCQVGHGRFTSFASFMIEKGFVRQLTRPEIADIAARVGVIHCSSCGAPVDLRKEDACSHCRSALSLLDPQAVEKALQHHASAAAKEQAGSSPAALGDAIVALARERSRAQREEARSGQTAAVSGILAVDLLSVGLSLAARLWED